MRAGAGRDQLGFVAGEGRNRFDGWYEQMADDEVRHRLVAECLGLPWSMRVTGLLSWAGLSEVIGRLDLEPGQVLVDLACGRGGYGRRIAGARGAELIGIDASGVAIAQARADLDRDGTSVPARFEVAGFEATGLPDEMADAVVCIDSYQFSSSQETLFAEAARITRPGGRLVVTGAMRRALFDGSQPTPVERAMAKTGWGDVQVSARPEWLVVEERFWRTVVQAPESTPALDALKAEGAELLQAMTHIQRFIAYGVRLG